MDGISEEYLLSLMGGPMVDAPDDDRAASVDEELPKLSRSSLELVDRVVLDMKSKPVIVCAEPGMGKTTLLSVISSRLGSSAKAVRMEDLAGSLPEEATKRVCEVARWCRRHASAEGERLVVLLDNMPCGDEHDVGEIVRFLRRIHVQGAMLIVAGLPECELISECLGEAVTYWSHDLCAMPGRYREDYAPWDERTHGIPMLEDIVRRLESMPMEGIFLDPRYQDAYASLVGGCVRAGIMREEMRLRCCVLLLGEGNLGEVERVLGPIDADLWRMLGRDVPLLGIDAATGSFCCLGARSSDALAVVSYRLEERVVEWPHMVARVADVLVGRGDCARAAKVLSLCSDPQLLGDIVFAHAVELLDVGELGIVERAVAWRREHDTKEDSLVRDVDILLATIRGTRAAGEDAPRQKSCGTLARVAILACRCRAALSAGTSGHAWRCREDDGPVAQALILHGSVITHMAQGRYEEAFMRLLESPARLREGSVTGALLVSDFVLASLLAGIAPSREDMDAFERAGTFLERVGCDELVALHELVLPVSRTLVGRGLAGRTIDAHIQRASSRGLVLLEGCLLLVAAVSDMRCGALTRSHVRLELATKSFRSAGTSMLRAVSRMLDLAIGEQMGANVTTRMLRGCGGVSEDLDQVVDVLVASNAGKRSDTTSTGRGRRGGVLDKCPSNVLWVVNVLSRDCGSFSRRFREAMPGAWQNAIVRMTQEVGPLIEDVPPGSMESAGGPVPSAPIQGTVPVLAPASPVEILLLGGFEVRVGGVPILGKRLERRRAKSMLALLASVPGHAAKRFTLMESVWPEHDYETANKCVYAATSVLRSELCPPPDVRPNSSVVVSNKTEGTVALDTSFVTCDVDAFEAQAHAILDSEGDDRKVVSLCREVEELYRGNLFVPSTDGAGIVESRARELRDLYIDAMIAGATAAGSLGMKMLACRFARKAHEMDDMREDAMRTLVIALCDAGRHIEAQQGYAAYAGRVIEVTRRPPSRRLRKVVEELIVAPDKGELGERARSRIGGRKSSVEIVDAVVTPAMGQLSLDLGGT